jgi:HPt (histidine-containing phosphotransfer) domain-containing protein
MPCDVVIDAAVFAELQATAGAEFAAELVATFGEEAPAMLAELRAAWQAKAPERFRRAAHSLKSNANTFGALALAEQARSLELAGALPADATAIDALAAALSTAQAALEELAHG